MGDLLAELTHRIVGTNAELMRQAHALHLPYGQTDTAVYFRIRGASSGHLWNCLQSALNGSKIGRVGHSRARLAYTRLTAEHGTYRAHFGELVGFVWEVKGRGRDLLIRADNPQPAQWEFVSSSGATYPIADVVYSLDCEVEQVGSWEWDRL